MKGTLFRLLRTSFRSLWGWEKLCGAATLRCSNGTTFSKMGFIRRICLAGYTRFENHISPFWL